MAFEQLFGVGGTKAEREFRRRTSGSILDWVTGRIAQLERELGPNDRERLDRYLQDVRELERRIQTVEARNLSGQEREPVSYTHLTLPTNREV